MSIISACPTLRTVDLLELPLSSAVCLSFVVRGIPPTSEGMIPLTAVFARHFYASHRYQAFRPDRGLLIHLEAVGLSTNVADTVVEAQSACKRLGVQAYRERIRNEEDWKVAWRGSAGELHTSL